MTVKITLEFPTVDAAIVALGKIVGGKAARAATEPVVLGATTEPGRPAASVEPAGPAPAEKTRKGRSDAGKPRGPRNAAQPPAEEPKAGVASASGVAAAGPTAGVSGGADASKAGQQPAASTSTTGAAVAPATGIQVPSEADAQKVLAQLFETAPPAGGIESSLAVLGRFGVAKLRDLPAERRAEFIAMATEMLKAKSVEDVQKALAGEKL